MEKKICKYTLTPEKTSYSMPKDAQVLCAGEQSGRICLWAAGDPKAEMEQRYFEIFKTGQKIPCEVGIERRYVSSVQIQSSVLALHVYERINCIAA